MERNFDNSRIEESRIVAILSLVPEGWRLVQEDGRLRVNPDDRKIVYPQFDKGETNERVAYLDVFGNTLRVLQRVCLARIDSDLWDEEIQSDLDARLSLAYKGANEMTVEDRLKLQTINCRERDAWMMASNYYLKFMNDGTNLEPKMTQREVDSFFQTEVNKLTI